MKFDGKEWMGGDVTSVVGKPFSYEFNWKLLGKVEEGQSVEQEIFIIPGLTLHPNYIDQPAVITFEGRSIKIGSWNLTYDAKTGRMLFTMTFNRYAEAFQNVTGFKKGSGKLATELDNAGIKVGDSVEGHLTVKKPETQPSQPPNLIDREYIFGKGVKWTSAANGVDARIEWRAVCLNLLQEKQKELIEENRGLLGEDGRGSITDTNQITANCLTVSEGNYIIEDTLDVNQRFSFPTNDTKYQDGAPFFFEIPVLAAGTGNFLNGTYPIGNANSYDGTGSINEVVTARIFTHVTDETATDGKTAEEYVRATPLTWTIVKVKGLDGQTREKLVINIGKLGTQNAENAEKGLTQCDRAPSSSILGYVTRNITAAQNNVSALQQGTNSPVDQLKVQTDGIRKLLESSGLGSAETTAALNEFDAWHSRYFSTVDQKTAALSEEAQNALAELRLQEILAELAEQNSALKDAKAYVDWKTHYDNLADNQQRYVENHAKYLAGWEYALGRYQLTEAFYKNGQVYGFVMKYMSEVVNTSATTFTNELTLSSEKVSYDVVDSINVSFSHGIAGEFMLGSAVFKKADSVYGSLENVGANGLTGAKFQVYSANADGEFEEDENRLCMFLDRSASTTGKAYVYSHDKGDTSTAHPDLSEVDCEELLEVDERGELALEGLMGTGEHYLVEAEAPAGYYLDKTPIPFEIDYDEETGQAPILYQMVPNVARAVKLTKASSYNSRPLAEAEFKLFWADGTPVTGSFALRSVTVNGVTTQFYQYDEKGAGGALKTLANGELNIHGLPAGSYYLQESTAAPGFLLPEAPQQYPFTLEEKLPEIETLYSQNGFYYVLANPTQDGRPAPVLNDEKTKTLTFTKIGEGNQPLTGAQFQLLRWVGDDAQWKKDPTADKYWEMVQVNVPGSRYFTTDNPRNAEGTGYAVDEDAQLTFSNIPAGHFAIVEVKAPEGYQLATNRGYFDVDVANDNPVQIYWNPNGNNPVPDNQLPNVWLPGSLKVYKIVAGNNGDLTRKFTFTITLTDDGAPLSDTKPYRYQITTVDPETGNSIKTLETGDLQLKNGAYTVELAHAEAITIFGLPAGAQYNVAETEIPGYSLNMTGGNGTIVSAGVATVTARNRYKTGLLRITKNVTGPNANREYPFEFTIDLQDAKGAALNGTFECMGTANTGIAPPAYTAVTFTGGRATVNLKAGQHLVITGLPDGATYTITETPVEGYATKVSTDDYPVDENGDVTGNGTPTTTIQGNVVEGSIQDNRRDDVDFNNVSIPDVGDLAVTKLIDGIHVDAEQEFVFSIRVADDEDSPVMGTFATSLKQGDAEEVKGEITFDVRGEATFALRHLDYLTIKGLPEGTHYTIEEMPAPGYVSSIGEAAKGTIEEDKAVEVVVTNYRREGNLIISKIVEGRGGNVEKEFNFTITLTKDSKPLTGSYPYVGNSIGPDMPVGPSGTLTLNENGQGSVKLKHGQRIVISGLPEGCRYTVEETADPQYVTDGTGATGEIEYKVEANARFVNRFKTGELWVAKTVTAGDRQKEFEFTVTLDDTSINGKYDEMVFVNGVAHFTLKHGEGAIAAGLPDGVRYTVTESGNAGYLVTKVDTEGVIDDEKIAIARFTNSEVTRSISLTKVDEGGAALPGAVFQLMRWTGTEEEFVANREDTTHWATVEVNAVGSAYFTTPNKQNDKKAGWITADTTGILTFAQIPVGHFALWETAAPEGYHCDSRLLHFDVTIDSPAIIPLYRYVNGREEPVDRNEAVNKRSTGGLTVYKTVVAGDKEQAFSFTVTLDDTTITGKYGDMSFENGVAHFTLKHGESKTAGGLPVGIAYTVTESVNRDYTVSARNETGNIPAEENVQVEFVNTKNNGTDPDKPVGPGIPGSPTPQPLPAPPQPQSPAGRLPQTGDMPLWPLVTLLCVGSAGILAIVMIKLFKTRKQR